MFHTGLESPGRFPNVSTQPLALGRLHENLPCVEVLLAMECQGNWAGGLCPAQTLIPLRAWAGCHRPPSLFSHVK